MWSGGAELERFSFGCPYVVDGSSGGTSSISADRLDGSVDKAEVSCVPLIWLAFDVSTELVTWLRLLAVPSEDSSLKLPGSPGTGGAWSRSLVSEPMYLGCLIARGVAGSPIGAEVVEVPVILPYRDMLSGSTVCARAYGGVYEVGLFPSSV